jgi:hypothetical protein
MTLRQLQQVVTLNDPLDQLKALGYTNKMTVGEAKKILEREYSIDMVPKEIKKVRFNNRIFKPCYVIPDLDMEEYALFKNILGDVFSDNVDSEDNIIPVPEEEKVRKLFNKGHLLLAIFLRETTINPLKKKLTFEEKGNMLLDIDAQIVVNILFFYSNVINNLITNSAIYYITKTITDEQPVTGKD